MIDNTGKNNHIKNILHSNVMEVLVNIAITCIDTYSFESIFFCLVPFDNIYE